MFFWFATPGKSFLLLILSQQSKYIVRLRLGKGYKNELNENKICVVCFTDFSIGLELIDRGANVNAVGDDGKYKYT